MTFRQGSMLGTFALLGFVIQLITCSSFDITHDKYDVINDARDVTNDAITDAITDANATVTAQYNNMSSLLDSQASNAQITNEVAAIDLLLSCGYTIIDLHGYNMYRKLEQTEALGSNYSTCTEGQQENVFQILETGYSSLEWCSRMIYSMQYYYNIAMDDSKRNLDTETNRFYEQLPLCVFTEEPTDEDTELILVCIDSEVNNTLQYYEVWENNLMYTVDYNNMQVEDVAVPYDRRCVEDELLIAGDNTAEFHSSMNKCVDDITNRSSQMKGNIGFFVFSVWIVLQLTGLK